ncbi:MAG: glycosyltransferase [Verrucomicrobia bacterium]|nr:glycosyltransferase [Verrucomicrobiota bacterium]
MKTINATARGVERRPKVSVLMLTYNHARYIAQAIQSVFRQDTTFEFELLIADDCSTDGTADVVRCLQQQYPGISLFAAKRNRGMYHNLAQIFYRAKGEYIAFLEGDDFWISPEKLQTQVQHLESDRKSVLCFHQARLLEDGQWTGAVFPQIPESDLVFEDFLKENWVPTCSAVFRRDALPLIPSWCADLKMLDWPMFLLLAQRGKVILLPEQLSAYRIHPAGVWSQLPPHRKSEQMIDVLRCVKQQVGKQYATRIDRRISELYEHIAWCWEERKAFDEALAASWKATLAAAPFVNPQALSGCVRHALRARFAMQRVTGSLQP